MAVPLRVLIVEDSEDDAFLLKRELQNGGYSVSAQRVETEIALIQALQTKAWDIVIADYNMPQFSGLAALRVFQEQGQDIPFFVVSGFIDEDMAVAAMRSGAQDYLMKDNLKRLVPAVERELRELQIRRERRQAADALRASEARMRQANDALLYLARSPSLNAGDLQQAFSEITQIAGLSLGVARASIWLFNEERTWLICQDVFELGYNQHTAGIELEVERYPRYVAALHEHRFISTHDTLKDPRTKELAEDYFIPLNIVSALEATIRYHNNVVGVFKLEHELESRRWMPEEEVFSGSVADLISLALGAHQRREAEIALRNSEQRYRDLFENANDMIYTLDMTGHFTSVNKRAEVLTGYSRSELLNNLRADDLMISDFRPITRNALDRKLGNEVDNTVYEVDIHCKDGSRLSLEINSRLLYEGNHPIGIQGIARDISERKNLEEQLRHAQKMEAIGRLAGAVAHDFNNLLTAILGYSQLLLLRLGPDSPWRREVNEIDKAGRSAAKLTSQLLAFSRKQEFQPQILNINQVILGIEQMLRRLIGEDIELQAHLSPQDFNIRADPSRLEQVIMNLVVNSRDAMPHGGRLQIKTALMRIDQAAADRHLDARPGWYVCLSISDSGIGIDQATQSRIFEPFFTTKGAGQGTGLGLSIVYGIVKQSEGFIEVESELGQGTSFHIFLPRVNDPLQIAEDAEEYKPLDGHETILVVEDDTTVRSLACQILEMNGYTVLEASDAKEALELINRHRGLVAAVLTDVIMPQISGPELVRQLRHTRPYLRFLYMSGYTDNQVLWADDHHRPPPLIPKPFTPETLLSALRTVLDEPNQAQPPAVNQTIISAD